MDYQEKEENTKEIQNLKELSEKALTTLELDLQNEMDENLEESTSLFEETVAEKESETQEEEQISNEVTEIESKPEEKKKKEKKSWKEKIKTLKEKWGQCSKPQKAGIIIGILLFLVLIGIGIYFLFIKKEQEETIPDVPNVIVDQDNYRYQNGTLVFLDKNKKELGTYTCKNPDANLCYVAYYNNEDDFDEPKMLYEDGTNIENRSKIILNEYVFIYDNKEEQNGLITLYNIKNEQEIDTYSLVKAYDALENQVILKSKMSQYGLFRITEEGIVPIINFSYDYLGIIQNNKEEINKIVAKRNNKWYLTDFNDKTLTKAINDEIKDYNDKYIKIQDTAGNYHLVDYNNVEMNTGNYEYIDLLENYVFFIQDQKLTIRDYENHRMNIDAIPLENKNYLSITTYNKEEKTQAKTENSYEVSYQGSLMKIEVIKENTKKDNYSINLNEGRISATLAYMDYFNGKLYFYEDESKEKLIGTYTCSNRNSLDDDTTTLNNCKLASESYYSDNDIEKNHQDDLGLLPIYNKRFVFISDNAGSNSTISLYDLQENAIKAKYKSVDAGAYTKTSQTNFATTNNTYIIAENEKGLYGVIQLGYDNLSSSIGFNFHHIERIGFHYLVQDSSGYYLMKIDGTRLTNASTNKIRNYNDTSKHVTRSNGKEYYLYPYEGDQEINQGYNYIELYDQYYAVVSGNTLKLYAYTDQKQEYDYFENQEIPNLELNNYYGSEIVAFKIDINGKNATVQIGTKEGSYKTTTVKLEKKSSSDSEGENLGN